MRAVVCAIALMCGCDLNHGAERPIPVDGTLKAEGELNLAGEAVLKIQINYEDGLDDCELDLVRFAWTIDAGQFTGLVVCPTGPMPMECVHPQPGCGVYVNETPHSGGGLSWCVGVELEDCPL